MGEKKFKNCKICGKNVPKGRLYCCSHVCMIELARKRARERIARVYKSKPWYNLICKICGNTFISHTPIAKTCSKPCRKEYRLHYAKDYYTHPDRIEKTREIVRESNRKRRLRPEVKEAEKIKNLLWRKNNPERVKELKREYHRRHPEKARAMHRRRKALIKGGGAYPKEGVVRYRMNLFGNCCYCKSDNKLTLEHLIPLSKGGHNGVCNLLGACQSCNSSKEKRDWLHWFRKQPFYDPAREQEIIIVSCN